MCVAYFSHYRDRTWETSSCWLREPEVHPTLAWPHVCGQKSGGYCVRSSSRHGRQSRTRHPKEFTQRHTCPGLMSESSYHFLEWHHQLGTKHATHEHPGTLHNYALIVLSRNSGPIYVTKESYFLNFKDTTKTVNLSMGFSHCKYFS